MHNQGFNRLVEPMDHLASRLEEKVIIQRGPSTYIPQYADHFDFTTSQRMEQLTSHARVVVSHCAAGSIIIAMLQRKPIVLVPRLKCFGEVYDDHQLQLAQALADQKKAIVVDNPSLATLRIAVNQVVPPINLGQNSDNLLNALQDKLHDWAGKVNGE
jgi:UDP-N-acetylglucosamine transferase subunit ALG13